MTIPANHLGVFHLGVFTDHETIRHQRLLPGSIEQVWSYLTEPALLARWLAGGKFEARMGGQINLDFDLIECPGREDVHGLMNGVVTEFDPPSRLIYTWNESSSATSSLVKYELESAQGGKTRLTLTHTRIAAKDLSSISAGWHSHIDVLIDRLEGKEPAHFMNAYYTVEPSYQQLLFASEEKK